MAATLHYIHDPLCGWCYGAAPLVAAARELLPVVAHGGGMMTGAQRQRVTPELRAYVMGHDRRIAQASGQPFGEGYFEGLLRDSGAVFDSTPPITAMLAAEALGGSGLDLLARVQHAHYALGWRIADPEVLGELAAGIGLERADFSRMFEQHAGAPTAAHIAASRALLQRVGGSGFPTFALEQAGKLAAIDAMSFLGQPQGWRAWLTTRIHSESTPASQEEAAAPYCGIDGCEPARLPFQQENVR